MTENRKMLYTNDLDGFDKVSTEVAEVELIIFIRSRPMFDILNFAFCRGNYLPLGFRWRLF